MIMPRTWQCLRTSMWCAGPKLNLDLSIFKKIWKPGLHCSFSVTLVWVFVKLARSSSVSWAVCLRAGWQLEARWWIRLSGKELRKSVATCDMTSFSNSKDCRSLNDCRHTSGSGSVGEGGLESVILYTRSSQTFVSWTP